MTNHQRSFRSREAAELFQCQRADVSFCSLGRATHRDVCVKYDGAWGRVHTYSYQARRKDGAMGTFWGSYVGA